MEDLDRAELVSKWKAKPLHRHILGASWGKLIKMQHYKAGGVGNILTKVSPRYTSQTCANCGCNGSAKTKIRLKDRVLRCLFCGWGADKDCNASLNILKIKTGTGHLVAPVESILKKYPRPFRTINKGSGLGASFLDDAGRNLRTQRAIHFKKYSLFI